MKETIKTLFTKIDDEMDVSFENLEGDVDKEIVVKELWRKDAEDNMFQLIDAVDKKSVLLYGRSHKKLNWVDGEFKAEVKDIFDILVDPKTSPLDIETARYIVEQNIFKSLHWIEKQAGYNSEVVKKLKNSKSANQTSGVRFADGTSEEVSARNERLESIGATNVDEFEVSDVIIRLNQHYTEIWDEKTKSFVRWVCVVAEDSFVLSARKLSDAVGVGFWPIVTWASDLEGTDYWSDGEGDTLRVPNKIVNIWMSQYMENRTLANYGMNYFDSTVEGFTPPTWEPKPGAWLGVPGKPNEVFKKVDVPVLQGSLDDIQFVIGMAERAVAATAMDKGGISDTKRTLGEIEIAVSKSMERTSTISKFYKRSHEDFAYKWLELYNANTDGESTITLYKKSAGGDMVPKEVKREDWRSNTGYKITAQSHSDALTEKTDELGRLFAIEQKFPNNAPLQKAIKKRSLQIANLTPIEIDEIIGFDESQYEQQDNIENIETVPLSSNIQI